MKIYFTSVSSEFNKSTLEKLAKFLEKNNSVTKVIYDINENLEGKSNDLNETLKEADVFIGEMSNSSQTLGFILSQAITLNKPCLYLYSDRRNAKPLPPILGNKSRLIAVQSYNDENLIKVISNFLNSADKKLKSARTTFMSTNKINNFLDEETKKSGLSKGEILRNILENYIDNH